MKQMKIVSALAVFISIPGCMVGAVEGVNGVVLFSAILFWLGLAFFIACRMVE